MFERVASTHARIRFFYLGDDAEDPAALARLRAFVCADVQSRIRQSSTISGAEGDQGR